MCREKRETPIHNKNPHNHICLYTPVIVESDWLLVIARIHSCEKDCTVAEGDPVQLARSPGVCLILPLFQVYKSESVKVWKCESVKVWKCESVKVKVWKWKCESEIVKVKVWKWKCESVKVVLLWQLGFPNSYQLLDDASCTFLFHAPDIKRVIE